MDVSQHIGPTLMRLKSLRIGMKKWRNLSNITISRSRSHLTSLLSDFLEFFFKGGEKLLSLP